MSVETQINYQQLFLLHCYHEEGRQALQKPFKKDGYYFASDGTSLLYLPQDEMELDFFIERDDAPNCLAVIPVKRSEPIEISINKLIEVINIKSPKIKEQEECYNCGGVGGEECNLGHFHDCEYCEGEGTYEKKDGKMIPDDSAVFVIDGVAMKIKMLQRLIQTAAILQRDTVLWLYRENEKGALFQLYPFHLLLMSCSNPPVDEDDKYINIDLNSIVYNQSVKGE
jgi:hypothetical protein